MNKMETTFPSDPSKFSGIWFCIHIVAKRCKTPEDAEDFIKFMNIIADTLPCVECRSECKEYMEAHRLEYFKDVTDKYGNFTGIFKWSWMFHNSVNLRLGKPIMDIDTAYDMYDVDELSVCTQGCGS